MTLERTIAQIFMMDDATWLRAAARNPAFNFLKEPHEDIYTVADGKPFHDKR